ncbi:LOW QUALITY PROTEIN: uncharacterized protein LOC119572297 [Penaeus monodon]|uniref:LOW QUALITY PROTEIN: uncharacterized protein LOC119572297 n=1 Tax=Penaeus monodon TaxID=6687 RepID=UPI0018A6D5CA|nr:LOW QUALITY PROTEIN: uncharacterized protein LOC119572297 [Penaeus monodon]
MSMQGNIFDTDSSEDLSYSQWVKGVRRRSRRLYAMRAEERRWEREVEKQEKDKSKERREEEEDNERRGALESLGEERPPSREAGGRGGECGAASVVGEAVLLGRSELPPPEEPIELVCVVEHRDPSERDDTPGKADMQNKCVIHLRTHLKNCEPSGFGCVKVRALKTLPAMLALSWSEVAEGEMGIWAKEDLGSSCFFGPYEGKKPPYSTKTRKCFCCKTVEKTRHQSVLPVHPSFPKYNWMRFVRGVTYDRDANLKPQVHQGQVFYAATRLIKKGAELVVNLNPGRNQFYEVTKRRSIT